MNNHGVLVLCVQRDVGGPARALWGACSSDSWPVAHLCSLELPEQSHHGEGQAGTARARGGLLCPVFPSLNRCHQGRS